MIFCLLENVMLIRLKGNMKWKREPFGIELFTEAVFDQKLDLAFVGLSYLFCNPFLNQLTPSSGVITDD